MARAVSTAKMVKDSPLARSSRSRRSTSEPPSRPRRADEFTRRCRCGRRARRSCSGAEEVLLRRDGSRPARDAAPLLHRQGRRRQDLRRLRHGHRARRRAASACCSSAPTRPRTSTRCSACTLGAAPTAVPGVPGLSAMNIDPEAAAHGLPRAHGRAVPRRAARRRRARAWRSSSPAPAPSRSPRSTSSPGSSAIPPRQPPSITSSSTPRPTGHTLRLLDAARRVDRLPRAPTPSGPRCLGPLAGPAGAAGALRGTVRRSRATGAHDPRARQPRPEPSALAEAERTSGELARPRRPQPAARRSTGCSERPTRTIRVAVALEAARAGRRSPACPMGSRCLARTCRCSRSACVGHRGAPRARLDRAPARRRTRDPPEAPASAAGALCATRRRARRRRARASS